MYLPEIMFFENFSIQNNSRKNCEKRHDTFLYKNDFPKLNYHEVEQYLSSPGGITTCT